MFRPITRRCCDCNAVLKNRRKATKRCGMCWLKFNSINAKGRETGSCLDCNRKLSLKINVTGRCKKCSYKIPRKPYKISVPVWNKGKSRFLNKEHERAEINKRRKELRSKMSPQEFISDRIRTLIRNSMKRVGAKKSNKTSKLLGCSIQEFRLHIEKQFEGWMNWDNYGNKEGQWNIDHIRPLITFDLTNTDQQLVAFNYSNCRPLLAKENFSRKKYLTGYTVEL